MKFLFPTVRQVRFVLFRHDVDDFSLDDNDLFHVLALQVFPDRIQRQSLFLQFAVLRSRRHLKPPADFAIDLNNNGVDFFQKAGLIPYRPGLIGIGFGVA